MVVSLDGLIGSFASIGWRDCIDIAVIAFLIYQSIKLVRETRAAQLIKGIAMLLLVYVVSHVLELRTMRFLTKNIFQVGVLAIVIVFQPELRRALEQVGRTRIGKFQIFSSGVNEQELRAKWTKLIDALAEEVVSLSRQRIGALVVLEKKTKLGDIIKTGTVIDSDPSPELIGNIFFPNSPLHDGALIVRGGRLFAAGCFLPLSDNQEISRELGTRHRAALGMSEASDALVVVVSEETGIITVCQNGKLVRGLSAVELRERMTTELLVAEKEDEPPKKKKSGGARPAADDAMPDADAENGGDEPDEV